MEWLKWAALLCHHLFVTFCSPFYLRPFWTFADVSWLASTKSLDIDCRFCVGEKTNPFSLLCCKRYSKWWHWWHHLGFLHRFSDLQNRKVSIATYPLLRTQYHNWQGSHLCYKRKSSLQYLSIFVNLKFLCTLKFLSILKLPELNNLPIRYQILSI